jgi:hypothetical protein
MSSRILERLVDPAKVCFGRTSAVEAGCAMTAIVDEADRRLSPRRIFCPARAPWHSMTAGRGSFGSFWDMKLGRKTDISNFSVRSIAS